MNADCSPLHPSKARPDNRIRGRGKRNMHRILFCFMIGLRIQPWIGLASCGLFLLCKPPCTAHAEGEPSRSSRMPIQPRTGVALHSPASPLPVVRLKSEEFVGLGSPFSNYEQALSDGQGSRVHVLLQVTQIPNRETQEKLRSLGIQLLDYIPDRTYFASLPRGLQEGVFSDASISWIGKVLPEDKAPARILEAGFGAWATQADGAVKLTVLVFSDVSSSEMELKFREIGAQSLVEPGVSGSRWIIRIVPNALSKLLQLDGVRWVEEVSPPPTEMLDGLRTNIQTHLVQAAPYGLSGSGVHAGVWDIGLADGGHPDFAGRLTQVNTNSPNGVRPHATHVASILGGDGADSVASGGYDRQWRGVAPGILLFSYDNLDEIAEIAQASRDHHVVLSQNSWGVTIDSFFGNCSMFGDYSADSAAYDRVVASGTGDRVSVFFAAGNSRKDPTNTTGCVTGSYGNVGPPASAKNVITVGAVYSDQDRMPLFSSWGPVDDGRIKPEIVAPGAELLGDGGIMAAAPGRAYRVAMGTSMATPAVCGAAALLVEDYRRLFLGQDPLPAVVRGLLLHSARDLVAGDPGFQPGPDYASGYGLLQVKEAVDQLRSGGVLVGEVAHHQTNRYVLRVPPGSASVKVTLTWDDPAAAENARVALVNDLDLVITDPLGRQHFPWTLDPANPSRPAIRTKEDHLNIVEQVVADGNVEPGEWLVSVRGYNVPVGTAQSFALVLTPASVPAFPNIHVLAADLEDTSEGNGDGWLDPGETIHAWVRLSVADGPVAREVPSTLSCENPEVAMVGGESFYSELAPGTVATNALAFRFRIGRAVPCGTILTFHQQVRFDGYPVDRQFTCVVGRPATLNSGVVDLAGNPSAEAIPDNGVLESVVDVAHPGLVTDTRVAVRIHHAWIADVGLELVHPDGERILLAKANTVTGQDLGVGDCGLEVLQTVFSDAASGPLAGAIAPYAGEYRPERSFTNLQGKPLAGAWKLRVIDAAADDAGSLLCWKLQIGYEEKGHVCSFFNRPPLANPMALQVSHSLPLSIALAGEDPDEDRLTFQITELPSHGTLSELDTTTGYCVYRPQEGYEGQDRFRYVVNDGFTNSASGEVTLQVLEPRADLALLGVESTPQKVVLGDLWRVNLILTNRGPNAAAGAVVRDSLPGAVPLAGVIASLGEVTQASGELLWRLPELPSGSSASLQMDFNPAEPGSFTNFAVVEAQTFDTGLPNNRAASVAEVNRLCDLVVSSESTPTSALTGQPFSLIFLVRNQGPSAATAVSVESIYSPAFQLKSWPAALTVVDNSPGRFAALLPDLANGEAREVILTFAGDLPGEFAHRLSGSSREFDADAINNAQSGNFLVAPATDLSGRGEVLTAQIVAGRPFEVALELTNRGPVALTGGQLNVVLPAGVELVGSKSGSAILQQQGNALTYDLSELPVGGQFRSQLTLKASVYGPVQIAWEAHGVEAELALTDNAGALSLQVLPLADLMVRGDYYPVPAAVGFECVLTWVVTNQGPYPAPAAKWSAALPNRFVLTQLAPDRGNASLDGQTMNWEIGDMAPGEAASLQVHATPEELGFFSWTGAVSSSALDESEANNDASFSVEVRAAADLVLRWGVSPGETVPGQSIHQRLVLTNKGPSAATSVVVSNFIGSLASVAEAQPNQGSVSVENGVLLWNVGTMEAGSEVFAELTLLREEPGLQSCRAIAFLGEADPHPADNEATAVTNVRLQAEVALSLGTSASTVFRGESVEYYLEVTNQGPYAATELRITDRLPAGSEILSVQLSQGESLVEGTSFEWKVGVLPPTLVATAKIVVRLNAEGEISNLARVDFLERDLNPADNEASISTTVVPRADVEVLGGAFMDQPLGSAFGYDLTVTNAGPSAATDVLIEIAPEAGLDLLSLASPEGSTEIIDKRGTVRISRLEAGMAVRVHLESSAPGAGHFACVAVVSALEVDPVLENNRLERTVNVRVPTDLALSWLPEEKPVVDALPFRTSLTIVNHAPLTASGVVLEVAVPSSLTVHDVEVVRGEAKVNGSQILVSIGEMLTGEPLVVTLILEAPAPGLVTLTGAVTSSDLELTIVDNSVSHAIEVRQRAELGLVMDGLQSEHLLGVSSQVFVGVTNAGPSAAHNVRMTVGFTGGLQPTSFSGSDEVRTNEMSQLEFLWHLLPTGSHTFVTLNLDGTGVGASEFACRVEATEADLDLSDNHFQQSIQVLPAADLGLGVSTDTPSLITGSEVRCALLITNQGPSEASGVVVSVPLPPQLSLISVDAERGSVEESPGLVRLALGEMPPGSVLRAELRFRANGSGNVPLRFQADCLQGDPKPQDNQALASLLIRNQADLVLLPGALPASTLAGVGERWNLVVSNLGPQTAEQVHVLINIPDSIELTVESVSQGSVQPTHERVEVVLGDIAANGEANLTVLVQASSAGRFEIDAQLIASSQELDVSNNAARASLTVVESADLLLTAAIAPAPAGLGELFTLTLAVTNQGPYAAEGVVLQDHLPASIELVSTERSQGQVVVTNGIVEWQAGRMEKQAEARCTLHLRTAQLGVYTNYASLLAITPDGAPSNNQATNAFEVRPMTDLVLWEYIDESGVVPGTPLVATFLVTNAGPSRATSAVLSVDWSLPCEISAVDFHPGSFTTTPLGGTFRTPPLDVNGISLIRLVLRPKQAGWLVFRSVAACYEVDSNPANNTGTRSMIAGPHADLALGVVDYPKVVHQGEAFTNVLQAVNKGPGLAEGVRLRRAVSAGVTLVSASLDGSILPEDPEGDLILPNLLAGQSVTLQLVMNSKVALQCTNSLDLLGYVIDPTRGDTHAELLTSVQPSADVSVAVREVPARAYLNRPWAYEFVVTNEGPGSAVDVRVTNSLPQGFTSETVVASQGVSQLVDGFLLISLGELKRGASCTVKVTGRSALPGLTPIGLQVASPTFDPLPGNNRASAQTTLLVDADLALTLRPSSRGTGVGLTNNFELRLENLGPDDARSVNIMLNLPLGAELTGVTSVEGAVVLPGAGGLTAEFPILKVGAPAVLEFSLRCQQEGALTLSADVIASSDDPDLLNNHAEAVLTVLPAVDLVVEQSVEADSAIVGETLVFVSKVMNAGPQAADHVVLTSALPPGFIVKGTSPREGSSILPDGSVMFLLGRLDADQSSEVRVDGMFTSAGTYQSRAVVSSRGFDVQAANNTSEVGFRAYEEADLDLSFEAAPRLATVHGPQSIRFVIANSGSAVLPGAEATLSFPTSWRLGTTHATEGTLSPDESVIQWRVGDLAGAAKAELMVTVYPEQVGLFTYQATVVSPALRGSNPHRLAQESVEIIGSPILSLQRSGSRVILTWPSAVNDCTLESTDDLLAGVWIENRAARVITGDEVSVTLKPAGDNRFFRLRRP